MAIERCETCGDTASQWDYDQLMYFCDRHVQQADFTVPLEEKRWGAWNLNGQGGWSNADVGDERPFAGTRTEAQAVCDRLDAEGRGRHEVREIPPGAF